MDYLIVLTTVSDEPEGLRLARHLVERRLAACANIQPSIRSVYRWQGEIQDEPECLLVLKTRGDLYEKLEAEILSAHRYDVPEVLALPVEAGSKAYLAWLNASLDSKAEDTNLPKP